MPGPHLPSEAYSLLELAENAVKAQNLPELAAAMLSGLARIVGSPVGGGPGTPGPLTILLQTPTPNPLGGFK